MAKKQPIIKETAAAAAPKTARAAKPPAKPKTPRVTAAQHSRMVSAEPPAAHALTLPDAEVIAKIAYGYWEARGCQGGSAIEDWVRAEREYLSQSA
jgi:hypothetical protein